MTLRSPMLDDRTFDQLVAEASARVRTACPEWTDLTPGDPGTTLLEAFAHLTEVLLYRVNRVPHKAYVEFLRLLGVTLQPPAAAVARLRFERETPVDRPTLVPAGTRVTTERGDDDAPPPVFATARDVTIAPGEKTAEVEAHDCEAVEAELIAHGRGVPGPVFHVARPPIVAPMEDGLDLVLAVEAAPDELGEGVEALRHGDRAFRVWTEVSSFAEAPDRPHRYVADRSTGRLTFAPAAMMTAEDGRLERVARPVAAVPPPDREIRAWYRRGGGAGGNVAPETLTVLKDPIAGVSVTNPKAATGGRGIETLENALVRGPLEFRTVDRAVTAADYESICLRSAAVSRARAFTRADRWHFGERGVVEVVLVPALPAETAAGGPVSTAMLAERQSDEALEAVQRELDRRRPLGVQCRVGWVRTKPVSIEATLVTYRQEDPDAVRRRLLDRLHRMLSPVRIDEHASGWRFGRTLRSSAVSELLMSEPGVSYVEGTPTLRVERVPSHDVTQVVADPFLSRVWYASAGNGFHRSVNGGAGWELEATFDGVRIEALAADPMTPGRLAAIVRGTDGDEAVMHVSYDCGEHWSVVARLQFGANDVAWVTREDTAYLLVATNGGLYEVPVDGSAPPLQVLVDESEQELGFSGVAVTNIPRGGVCVVLSARQTRGVYLSDDAGRHGTFRSWGLSGEDVGAIEVQREGSRLFVWAGLRADQPGDRGDGAQRRELRATAEGVSEWRAFGEGWRGGSVRGLAFGGSRIFAASYRAGVLRLDPTASPPAWVAPTATCGLPLRDEGTMERIDAVACDAAGTHLLVGGEAGIFASPDDGVSYAPTAREISREAITIPETWLLCSGEHRLTVRSEDGG